jgi:hypothetical protein
MGWHIGMIPAKPVMAIERTFPTGLTETLPIFPSKSWAHEDQPAGQLVVMRTLA